MDHKENTEQQWCAWQGCEEKAKKNIVVLSKKIIVEGHKDRQCLKWKELYLKKENTEFQDKNLYHPIC